jgi:enterochelin esterase-like enzyme
LTSGGVDDWDEPCDRHVTVETPPLVTADAVTFRLPDAGAEGPALAGTRLLPALSLPEAKPDDLEFGFDDGEWHLTLRRPPAWRMEYKLQLRHPEGEFEEICDPSNPLRVPGAFGDKSVVEFPDYLAPAWLAADKVGGDHVDLSVPAPSLGRDIALRLWGPVDVESDEPLPLLVAHDGPEYDKLAALTGFSAALIEEGRLPRHRVALLQPGERNDEYSANPDYAAALHDVVLPFLREAVAVDGPVAGMGASLGGLAMLHAQRTYPGLFAGLFLQSASFLDPRLDPQEEQRFSHFPQVSTYVRRVMDGADTAEPIPVTLTCGLAEENLENNRQMALALTPQGYEARLVETPDAHNYVSWRDGFDPALAELLRRIWEG